MVRYALSSLLIVAATGAFATSLIPPDSAQHVISGRAREVVEILAKKEVQKLAPYIHPELHLRFSPYGFIGQANRKFTADDIASIWKNKQKFFWGLYNGSGKPIRRTFSEYFKRFVYDRDFLSSSLIAYNAVQRTDMFSNVFDIYPNAIVVDHLFLASPEFEEMDWRSLRLVFQEYQGEWYLVHIVHDEWTV